MQNLQDMANNLRNAGQTLESNSFEMIEHMSKCINDPDASYVKMNFSQNVGKKKVHYKPLKFKCNKCFDSFNDKSSLVNHHTVHYKMSYSCSKCTKVLCSYQSFLNHLSVHKSGEHVCQQCEKSFSLKSSLTNHLHVHNDTTDVCTTCKKEFRSRAKYLKHVHTCVKSSQVDEGVTDFDSFLVE